MTTRIGVAVLALGAWAACVRPGVVHCDDGRTCPAGTVCSTGVCALPVQLTACEELLEGETCSFPGATGVCLGGVCTPTGCGNGTRDLDEVCDDGNRESGDGCSSDCQSNEECGDNAPNPFLGEECDDGNHLDHDGCSSTCLQERGVWTRIDTGPPAPRRYASMAYDYLRKRVVLFGGVGMGNEYFNDTWEWDGVRWTRIDVLASPPRRLGGAMAFDPITGRIVLFGGLGTTSFSDTWEYFGTTWRQIAVPSAPRPRYGHAMAYDGTRKRIVMVGGSGPGMAYDDAFAWEGDRWTPLPSLPSPRMEHAMAYDPIRGQLVLFSGRASVSDDAIDDAWTLDANGWIALPPSGAPRSGGAAAFDVANGRILVFGGTSDGTQISAQSTLTAWDGTAWSTLAIPAPPSPRTQAPVAYDIARGELVVFGGYQMDFSYDNNTFLLATSWRTAAPPLRPSSIDLASAWDPERNFALVVGSADAGTVPAQTLRWDGGFSLLPTGPSKRVDALLARDKAEIVMTGGRVPGTGPVTDTWSWDGTWTSRATGAPLPRIGAAFAPEPDGLLLFGGLMLGDTWRWRNGAWAMLAPPDAPSARSQHGMAFDPVRGRTVLHGGREMSASVGLDDTWEWDGTTWTRVAALGTPPRLSSYGLVFDPVRATMVAVGEDGSPGTSLNEWDGTTWSTVVPDTTGPTMTISSGTAFYDRVGHGLVVIGPIGASDNDVWRFRYQSASRDEVCGSGRDVDSDGLVDCLDPDCWYVCTPSCSPGMTCDPQAARCGDGACNAPIETCDTCNVDCGACAAACGDLVCAPGETCLGDC